MKENLSDLFLAHFCSNQFGFDKLFRSVFDEDRVIVLLDNDRLIKNKNFILHYGKVYICTMIDDENMYMEESTDNQKMQIITDVLNGAKTKYNDFNLFDDETLEKLKALSTLEFDELTAIERNREGYLDTLSMKFRKTSKNREYQYCDIEFGYNEEIYKYIENFNYNGLGIICTKELINAKRDVNVIYQNTMEGL